MKIFLIASANIFSDKAIKNAASLRSEQFLRAIKFFYKRADIFLVSLEDDQIEQFSENKHQFFDKNLKIFKNHSKSIKIIKKHFLHFDPDLLVAVNTYPSFIAARLYKSLDKKIPFWADLNGWSMAEAQAQAKSLESNLFIPRIYEMEKTVIDYADKISTVSDNQKYATYGELAFRGRLSKENFHHKFVYKIANSQEEWKSDLSKKENDQEIFNITQIGGFNAWFDEKTLFEALEIAMEQNDKIHFTTTGADLKGIDEKTYPRFQKRVSKSKFKDRMHLLGWVKSEEIENVYLQADCILNVDFDCVETIFGARNRLTEGLKYNLPVVSTLKSEIAEDIKRYNAGLTVENSNPSKLAEAFLQLASDKKLCQELALNGKKLLKEEYSLKKTMQDFIFWLKNPSSALDKDKRLNIEKSNLIKAGIFYLKTRGIKAFFIKMKERLFS